MGLKPDLLPTGSSGGQWLHSNMCKVGGGRVCLSVTVKTQMSGS